MSKKARFFFRRNTSADWAALNPVLGPGEPGYDEDAKTIRVGDGVSHWADLLPFALSQDIQDALDAVGTGNVQSVAGRIGDVVLSSVDVADFPEAVQDLIGNYIAAGANLTKTYDDVTGVTTLSIVAPGEWVNTDPEVVRDTIGGALAAGSNVSISVNDAGDTITISTTATVNSTDAELRDRSTHTGVQAVSTVAGLQAALDAKADASTVPGWEAIEDRVAGLLVPGANVTITYDDVTGALTISASSGSVPPLDIQVFTASGTWTKPAGGQTQCRVQAIGPGGGGGGAGIGLLSDITTAAMGGGGGGGGAFSEVAMPLSMLGATEAVQVGIGGAGGAGKVSNAAVGGNNGTTPLAASSFGTNPYLRAAPGSAGIGGGSAGTGGTGGGAGATGDGAGSTGGASSSSGNAGNGSATNTRGATGGGGGGARSATTDSARAGGSGGLSNYTLISGGSLGASTLPGVVGNAGRVNGQAGTGGGGGGAGAGNTTNPGRNGGDGGFPGGGGGGGGAARTDGVAAVTSGGGGKGGDGVVVVTSW